MEKVIDLEDRIPSFRERRKRRTNLKFIILTTLFVLILLFLLYLQSSYSKVKKIVVEGSVLEEQQFYIDESEILLGDSIWGFTIKDVEKKLTKLDWVQSVEVKRNLLTTVSITVKEYKKVAFFSEDDSYYPMLENGFIYKEIDKTIPIDAPVFVNFSDESLRKRLLKELTKIDGSILALISQINAVPTDSDPFTITLYMNDGYEIRADITTLAEKIKHYPSIIAQIESVDQPMKGIIDIEVGTYYQSYENEYGAMSITTDGTTNENTTQTPSTSVPIENNEVPTNQQPLPIDDVEQNE